MVAILVLFEQYLVKFLPLNLGTSPTFDAFCSYIFEYACLGRKANQNSSKLWKNCIHQKTCLEMAGGGNASL